MGRHPRQGLLGLFPILREGLRDLAIELCRYGAKKEKSAVLESIWFRLAAVFTPIQSGREWKGISIRPLQSLNDGLEDYNNIVTNGLSGEIEYLITGLGPHAKLKLQKGPTFRCQIRPRRYFGQIEVESLGFTDDSVLFTISIVLCAFHSLLPRDYRSNADSRRLFQSQALPKEIPKTDPNRQTDRPTNRRTNADMRYGAPPALLHFLLHSRTLFSSSHVRQSAHLQNRPLIRIE